MELEMVHVLANVVSQILHVCICSFKWMQKIDF